MLTPHQQLDKTLGLALDYFDRHDHLMMGVILRPLRLFNRGDFIVFYFDNGQAERWLCTGVSSKGYSVKNFYVLFQAWYPSFRRRTKSKAYAKYDSSGKSSSIFRNASFVDYSGQTNPQHVSFLDVVKLWSSDPAVQQEIVGFLRARTAAFLVGSGSQEILS